MIAIQILMAEVKALEKKKQKIKTIATQQERAPYPTEHDKIIKLTAQQMILRKMARKIQRIDNNLENIVKWKKGS